MRSGRQSSRVAEGLDDVMNFELTEQQQLVQETARRFALEEIAPTLEEEEKNHKHRGLYNIGLSNVRERINMNYGEGYEIEQYFRWGQC